MTNFIITIKGRHYQMINDPYLADNCFEALAICTTDTADADGYQPAYMITWSIIEGMENAEDYSDMADWENPDNVRREGEYNVSTGSF